MKKALKFIVPLLLILVILGSMVWYCFIYDQEFTRDMMLQNARFFSRNGNQTIASWFYDMAYKFCAQDDDVAIELADQYKDEGNYTKAEYTLTNAISDGGGADLYIALSKTYVEQNKLLDAVTMLDSISNPEIKAQLDAIRPAVPSADPAPGFYSQYITVNLNHEGGTLYFTLDGEYPSIDSIPYADPITLPGGETVIYSVTVADNGLVSPLSILGYTITGVIEEVAFEDAAIEAAVRTQLEIPEDEAVFTDQLWSITKFTVPDGASSLNDLSRMAYLEELIIHDVSINSLSFLSSMANLKLLDLSGCSFPASDLSIIGTLTKLQSLNLENCGLSTIAGLENNTALTYLNLANNTIRKLDSITPMTGLKELYLQHNAVVSTLALSSLSSLETLDVSYNALSEIAPLASCSMLSWLNASNNKLTDLTGVNKMSALKYLSVSENALDDVSILAECTGLTELYIAGNSIDNITSFSTLVNLEVLDFAYNKVAKLPKLPDDCALRIIDGSYNDLTGLSALKSLENLTHIYMDYNEISSIASLANCHKLMYISVYGSAVTGVNSLTQKGIIVNYNPNAEVRTAETEAE